LRLVEALPWEPSDSSAFMSAEVPGFFWNQSGRSDYKRYHHTHHDPLDGVMDKYQVPPAWVGAIAGWNLATIDRPSDRQAAEVFSPPAPRTRKGCGSASERSCFASKNYLARR
jgi:hypothetical protein